MQLNHCTALVTGTSSGLLGLKKQTRHNAMVRHRVARGQLPHTERLLLGRDKCSSRSWRS